MCKSQPGSTGFEGMKGSWPGQGIGEGVSGVVVEAPGWKRSWRKAEALYHEEGPGGTIGKSVAQL